jgi:hypothetical protein
LTGFAGEGKGIRPGGWPGGGKRPFRWLDEFKIHGADGVEILEHDGGEGAAAFAGIALDAADEADVGVGIHEHLDIHQAAQFGFGEDEDAVHENDGGGLDGDGFGEAGVGGKVIDRQGDGAALAEFADMAGKQVAFEGVGVVHILLRALFHRQVRQVAVVGVVGEIGDVAGADAVENLAGDGGFAGGGAAGDAEDDGR